MKKLSWSTGVCARAEDVVTPEQTGRILRVVPEREGHRLELRWAVPAEERVYRHAPCGFLGHLLGCGLRSLQARYHAGCMAMRWQQAVALAHW